MPAEKGKRHSVIKVLLLLAGIGILFFCGLMGYVCIREGQVSKETADLQEEYDAVIVLGAQVKPDGTPSVQLSWRLDKAAEAWGLRNVPIVVCGARGNDEPEAEAFAMKRYLTGKEIPEEMILTDPDSFNTRENLANAKKLLDGEPQDIRKVLIVTSDYHVPRAMALAGDLGCRKRMP